MHTDVKTRRALQTIDNIKNRAAHIARAVVKTTECLLIVEDLEEHTTAVNVLRRTFRTELQEGHFEDAREAATALKELRMQAEYENLHAAACEICHAAANHENEIRSLTAVLS